MKINKFTKRGIYHTRKRRENQDYATYKETSDVIVAAIADGATRCKYGLTGAKIACDTAVDLLTKRNFFEFEKLKISFIIFEEISCKIRKEAEKTGEPSGTFASTLIFACYDKKSHRLLTANLGDGSGFVKKDKGYVLVSPPQRLSGRGAFTVNKDAFKYASVDICDASEVRSVFICSDGVTKIVDENYTEIDSVISNADSLRLMDDFSFIEINMR